MSLLLDQPHRRLNALTGEWVSVSPQRNQRPWQGRVETHPPTARAAHDPSCYLCPGNLRANGERNPKYSSTFAFTNDFPAFLPDTPAGDAGHHPLLHATSHAGTCRVLCFSPRHDLTLAQLPQPQIRAVIEAWVDQTRELGQRWRWVQVFENKGEIMGCSNPHPHGQIWACDALPNEAVKELSRQREWLNREGRPLLLEYADVEGRAAQRIVAANDHWLAVVPWWAVWPFENLLMPRRHVPRLSELTSEERDSLADVLQRLLGGYDRLFETSFPYSFGWHGAPSGGGEDECWQLHAHFYPPLLRSATVKKFMVGYEMLAESQRDLTAEHAAERLRAVVGGERVLT